MYRQALTAFITLASLAGIGGCGRSSTPDSSGSPDASSSSPDAANSSPNANASSPNAGNTSVDAKDVAANTQQYAGQTLESNLRLMGFGQGACGFKDPANDTYVFSLVSPNKDVTEKLIKDSQLAGDFGWVIVTYKVNDPVVKDAESVGTIIDVRMK
jgi:hypothetical protein